MTDWKKHWTTFPEGLGPYDYFKQVGKTVNGRPISIDQFSMILDSISEGLALELSDTVLDLCCGNGLITSELATTLSSIVGVDFSEPLLRVANRDHLADNIHYRQMSPLNALTIDDARMPPFNKIYMYEALQHFRLRDLRTILLNILAVSSEDAIIFLGSIPDKKRLWSFYNTPRRRIDYFFRKVRGKEAIGTWWTRDYIESVCHKLGLHSEYISQNEDLYTSHYRFNFRISRVQP